MADVLTGNSYVTRERTARRERRLHRILVIVIAFLAVALVSEILYHLVIIPKLAITSITITNEVELSDEETDPGPGFDLQTTDTPINAVVVTQFSENPFPEPILGQSTQARIRVESDGRTRYFSVVVRLLDNPFGPRRFAFLTDSSGGQ